MLDILCVVPFNASRSFQRATLKFPEWVAMVSPSEIAVISENFNILLQLSKYNNYSIYLIVLQKVWITAEKKRKKKKAQPQSSS